MKPLAELDARGVRALLFDIDDTFSTGGKILAHATQRRDERRFELFANPDLVGNVERLVAATGLNGPANFDAVLEDETGLAYIVECNPRFWFTIHMSMIVGLK